jgi:hypothetical protein
LSTLATNIPVSTWLKADELEAWQAIGGDSIKFAPTDRAVRQSSAQLQADVNDVARLPVIEGLLALAFDTFPKGSRAQYVAWATMWRRLIYRILPAVGNCDLLSKSENRKLVKSTANHISIFMQEIARLAPDVEMTYYFHELQHWLHLNRRLRFLRCRLSLRPAHFGQSPIERANGMIRRMFNNLTTRGGGITGHDGRGAQVSAAQVRTGPASTNSPD